METKAQKPQNQKHYTNCPKHSHILLLIASTPKELISSAINAHELRPTVFRIHNGNTVQDCSPARVRGEGWKWLDTAR